MKSRPRRMPHNEGTEWQREKPRNEEGCPGGKGPLRLATKVLKAADSARTPRARRAPKSQRFTRRTKGRQLPSTQKVTRRLAAALGYDYRPLPALRGQKRLGQTTTATTRSRPVHGHDAGILSGKWQGLVVGSFHGNLFLYVQELAPCPRLRMVAGASLSLSLSASV